MLNENLLTTNNGDPFLVYDVDRNSAHETRFHHRDPYYSDYYELYLEVHEIWAPVLNGKKLSCSMD